MWCFGALKLLFGRLASWNPGFLRVFPAKIPISTFGASLLSRKRGISLVLHTNKSAIMPATNAAQRENLSCHASKTPMLKTAVFVDLDVKKRQSHLACREGVWQMHFSA